MIQNVSIDLQTAENKSQASGSASHHNTNQTITIDSGDESGDVRTSGSSTLMMNTIINEVPLMKSSIETIAQAPLKHKLPTTLEEGSSVVVGKKSKLQK